MTASTRPSRPVPAPSAAALATMLAVLAVLVAPEPAVAACGGALDASRTGAVSSLVAAAARSLFLVDRAAPVQNAVTYRTPVQRLAVPGPSVLLQIRCVVVERLHDLPPPC